MAPTVDGSIKRRSRVQRLSLACWGLLAAGVLAAASKSRLLQPGAVAANTQQQQQQHQQVALPATAPLPAGFRFNKVVALIAFDRFEYFRRAVAALRMAWGAEVYTLTIWIDGPPANASAYDARGWRSVVQLSRQLRWLARSGAPGFRAVAVHVAPANLGVWANKRRGVAGAMALSDFAVILEDDVVVEADALRWFEWHITSGLIFRQPDLAVATCWSPSFPHGGSAVEGGDLLMAHQLGLLDKYWLRSWAVPWGWALWRRTWDAVGEPGAWNGRDVQLGRLVQARGWVGTVPLVARCNNIGAWGVHKQGATQGHVHQRAVTSGAFHGLDRCRYRLLPRPNTTALPSTEPVYNLVRRGLADDSRFSNVSLEEQQAAAAAFVAGQPDPALWQSTC